MAIGKFFKGFFSYDYETEVEVDEKSTTQTSHTVTRDQVKPRQTQKVTLLSKERDSQPETSRSHRLGSDKGQPSKPKQATKQKQTSKPSFFSINKDTNTNVATEDAAKELNYMNASPGDTKVHLFEPRVFSETQDIADELKRKKATLVNLSKVDGPSKKRIVDFLSGTVYALNGDIQKVGQDIFLCTPSEFGVAGEISGQYEQNEE